MACKVARIHVLLQAASKPGCHATPAAPKTPKQSDKARHTTSHGAQPQQALPAFRRHVLPCQSRPTADAIASKPHSKQPRSPEKRWEQHPPPQAKQQRFMQKESLAGKAVQQLGAEQLPVCSTSGAGVGVRWQPPSVRYRLSSPEPALGAGVWEEQATRYILLYHSEQPVATLPSNHSCSGLQLPVCTGGVTGTPS